MTLRQLRIFAAGASAESITKAAEELYLTQPTVSVAIREMERHYGTRLFERINQRLRITEEGKALLSYASHLLDLYDEMEKMFQNPDSRGSLRVGASLNVGSCYMPGLLRDFQRRFPGIRVQMHVNTTGVIEKLLLENEADLAVAGGLFHSPFVELVPLFSERYEAVCSPEYPLAGRTTELREFMEQPLLARERGSGAFEAFQAALSQFGRAVEPAWESNSQEALLEAACSGLGVTILPRKLAEREFERKRLARVVLSDFSFQNTVYLARHKHKYLSPGMKLFSDFVQECLAKQRPQNVSGEERR